MIFPEGAAIAWTLPPQLKQRQTTSSAAPPPVSNAFRVQTNVGGVACRVRLGLDLGRRCCQTAPPEHYDLAGRSLRPAFVGDLDHLEFLPVHVPLERKNFRVRVLVNDR